ncbi:hypothetical protein DPMN_163815 [Dreissena polymorpha]|uniref:Uncharacterized protein n=1 Tax=Dreissena polymorpha TaxID=45954 RepID=A0A9D4IUY7_DREPO|nr:hypothetical protein DPMN_163815 [Dreissena polymorpha]
MYKPHEGTTICQIKMTKAEPSSRNATEALAKHQIRGQDNCVRSNKNEQGEKNVKVAEATHL